MEATPTKDQAVKKEKQAPPKSPRANRGLGVLREILIFVVILGVGVLAAWGINKLSENDKDDSEPVAQLPTYTTPNTGSTGNQGDSPATDYQTPPATTPEEPSAPQYGTPSPTQPDPVVPSQPQIYKNTSLGFSITLPIGWTDAPESTAKEIIFADRLHANVISSVEVYNNNSGETLDTLMNQLQKSPSVSNVKKITVNGIEWIEFTSNSGTFNRGIVTIHNGKIYYLNGELSKSPFATALKFL